VTSVCILSAAWRRFDITRLVLAQRQRLCVELAARGVEAISLIVADDENIDIAREHGCETVEAANRLLGEKWNIGLRHASQTGADWVVWVGSDDWIHPAVFDPIIGRAAGKPVIVTGRRLGIVDLRSGRLQRLSSPSQYGAIPWLLDARLLRTVKTAGPIPPDAARGLDGALVRGLRLNRVDFDWEWHDPHDFRCIDFKTEENITPYAGLAKNLGVGEPEPAWATLKEWFPADLVEQARSIRLPALSPASRRRIGDAQPMRLINPATGDLSSVSAAAYTILRARGWVEPHEQAAPAPERPQLKRGSRRA